MLQSLDDQVALAPRWPASPFPGLRPFRVTAKLRNADTNYPFESSRGFPGSEPNCGHGDQSRLSCSAGDKQLGAGFCRDLQCVLHRRWPSCGVAEKARIGRDLFRSEDDPPAAKANNTIAQFALDFPRKESVRWICEQAHQQLKEELGLDHFEGRSWQGLHRHALMTMIAYAFLQHRRLAAARREKKNHGPPPQPTLPAVRYAILELIARLPPQRCPHCRKWICSGQRRE